MNKLRSVGHVLAKQMSRSSTHSHDIDLNTSKAGLEVDVGGAPSADEWRDLPDDLGVPLLTPSRQASPRWG